METRFAGSERLAERRRRRLAVEADDVSPSSDEIVELSSVATSHRVAHSGSAASEVAPIAPLPALPLARLIPAAWWKYLLAGLAGLAVLAGTIAAGWYAPSWAAITGLHFDRLFSSSTSPAANWLAGLLLGAAAQLALVTWWGRSRSRKDFDGQYRVWTWAAAACLLLSCCAATGAHRLLGDVAVAHLPGRVPRKDIWGWLLPSLVAAARLLPALRREMSGCRASRWLLYSVVIAYAAAVVIEFDLLETYLTGRIGNLVQQSAGHVGHLGLLMSMWVHARHVLYSTADPGPASSRPLRIPRPHFRLPGLRLRSRVAVATEVAELPPERKRRKGKRKSAPSEPAPSQESPTPELGSAGKPIDAHEPATRTTAEQRAERAQIGELPAEPDEPRCDESPQDNSERTADDADEVCGEPFEKPNLKGLSKKQRRRLMQEMRDRERASRHS